MRSIKINSEDAKKLLAFLQLHQTVGEYKGKGTTNISDSINWQDVAKLGAMLYTIFPKDVKDLGADNRSLIRHRLTHLTDNQLNTRLFELLFQQINRVYSNWLRTRRGCPGKFSINHVRNNHTTVYNEIMQNQGHRCAYCGYLFTDQVGEQTLDHIIPYRLGGDHVCGSNWQVLCRTCNSEKKDMFSIFQHRVANDWIYHLKSWTPEQEIRTGRNRIQFAVLLRDKVCKKCKSGPTVKQLIALNESTGLSIPSNMVCVCVDYPEC